MTPGRLSGRLGAPILALHLAALLGGCGFAWLQWSDVAAERATVDQARDVVDQLDARLAALGAAIPAAAGSPPAADPFLQGASQTVAGAGLQARVVAILRDSGGTVTSSQIDMSGAGSTPPAILLTVSCQIDNVALQRLLYTLEASTPALFVDQLTIESSGVESSVAGPGGIGPLKIAMTILAYWRGDGRS